MSRPADAILRDLEELIRDQIAEEWDDQDRRDEEFENLTVANLLRMLSYINLNKENKS